METEVRREKTSEGKGEETERQAPKWLDHGSQTLVLDADISAS